MLACYLRPLEKATRLEEQPACTWQAFENMKRDEGTYNKTRRHSEEEMQPQKHHGAKQQKNAISRKVGPSKNLPSQKDVIVRFSPGKRLVDGGVP